MQQSLHFLAVQYFPEVVNPWWSSVVRIRTLDALARSNTNNSYSGQLLRLFNQSCPPRIFAISSILGQLSSQWGSCTDPNRIKTLFWRTIHIGALEYNLNESRRSGQILLFICGIDPPLLGSSNKFKIIQTYSQIWNRFEIARKSKDLTFEQCQWKIYWICNISAL